MTPLPKIEIKGMDDTALRHLIPFQQVIPQKPWDILLLMQCHDQRNCFPSSSGDTLPSSGSQLVPGRSPWWWGRHLPVWSSNSALERAWSSWGRHRWLAWTWAWHVRSQNFITQILLTELSFHRPALGKRAIIIFKWPQKTKIGMQIKKNYRNREELSDCSAIVRPQGMNYWKSCDCSAIVRPHGEYSRIAVRFICW